MATKTSNKKSVPQEPKTKEANVNSALAEENATLKNQLEEMMKNYKDMQLQLQNMLIAQQANASMTSQAIEGSSTVGCRIFNGVTLSSQGGDIAIPIQYREEVDITYPELREIFKNPFGYKNMFRKGILYFVNEDDYKKFNIKVDIDLEDDALSNLLTKSNGSSIIDAVKSITNDKKDLTEMFALIYQIAYLIDKKKVDLDYEVRSNLEKYFDVDFKTLINNLHQ